MMWWILVAGGGYLALLAIVARLSLKPPRTPIYLAPGSFEVAFEEISIESPTGKLPGWWIPAPDESIPEAVAIFCHGYVMNRCELAPQAMFLAKRGVASLSFDFRAHGKAKGSASCGFGFAEREDVRAAVAWVNSRAPGARIVLIGSSMGSVAAAFAMAEDESLADALVLDSAYSKLSNAVSGWWEFVGGWPLKIVLFPTQYVVGPFIGLSPWRIDVGKALSKVRQPVLVMHGDRDRLSKPTEAKRNIAHIPNLSGVVWFKGAGHSEGRWEQSDLYHDALASFLIDQGMMRRDRWSSQSLVDVKVCQESQRGDRTVEFTRLTDINCEPSN